MADQRDFSEHQVALIQQMMAIRCTHYLFFLLGQKAAGATLSQAEEIALALHERARVEGHVDHDKEFASSRQSFWLMTMRIDPDAPTPQELPPEERKMCDLQREVTRREREERWVPTLILPKGS